jgi:hypothetical protein
MRGEVPVGDAFGGQSGMQGYQPVGVLRLDWA